MAEEPTMVVNFSTGDQVRINVRCAVNKAKVSREKRDGRDVIVVPSYTMPDNVVMNGILYPAEEIAKSYKTLEGTPAPLGHPTVNGIFVSAKSPLGLNIGYFGAWNAKVERDNGRVFIEKVIDVKRANESEMGRRVLAAIDKGDPIHTSTGLLTYLRPCQSSECGAKWEAYDIEFDHDAILLDEQGAATPEQGVGMLVNNKKVPAINSDLEERIDENIDALGMELLRAIRSKQDAGLWASLKAAIMDLLALDREQPPQEEDTMASEETGLAAVENKICELASQIEKLSEAISNIGATVEAHSGVIEQINAEHKAKRDKVINAVVEAKLLTKEIAETTPTEALEKLLANAKKQDDPVPAPGIFGAFHKHNDFPGDVFSPLEATKQEA